MLPAARLPGDAVAVGIGDGVGAAAGGTDLAALGRYIGVAVTRAYQSADAITGHDGPFGFGSSWTYSTRAVTLADGSVVIIEGSGSRSVFTKTGSTWTASPGINATLVAGGSGGYVVTRHDQSTLTFDAAGKLTSLADRNANTLTLTYSGANLSTVTAPGGRGLSITTNGQGRITQISYVGSQMTPALSTSYTYDGSGNLAAATDAAGAVTRYTYDSRHQLLTIVDANTHTAATLTYGTLGRVTTTTNAVSQSWSTGYAYQGYAGSFGALTTTTEPRGHTSQTANDGGLRAIQTDVYTNGTTLLARGTATYNSNGDVLTATDPLGRVTAFTYDSRANVLTTTADAGFGTLNLTTTFTYTTTNDVLTVTDPAGHTGTNTYDTHGKVLTTTDPLSHTTGYSYDSYGALASVTDATGHTTTFGYAFAGDRTSVTVAAGKGQAATTTTSYDGAGRPISVSDPLGQTTTATYDGRGRVLSATDALSHTTTTAYDAVGNRTSATDPNNHATTWAYDTANRLLSVTDAAGGVTTYGYDQVGNRTSMTNALGSGHTWSSTYDALGRTLTETDPLSHTTTYTYDAAGNLLQTQRPNGATISYTYDRVYRPTAISPSGMTAIGLTYDTVGRRTQMTDATGTTTYGYDTGGRLTGMTAPVTGTVGYSYDNANRMTGLTYPGGRQVTYSYDDRGQLAQVADAGGVGISYTHDAAGRRTGSQPANGMPPSVYAYDNANRLTSITHTYLDTNNAQQQLTIGYTYDAAGNRLTMSDNRATPAGTTTYTYDTLNRLTQVVDPASATTSYGYDAVGNRTSLTQAGTTTTATFDAANRMLSDVNGTYTYDTSGNQLTKTAAGVTTTYTYDALDRMTGLTGGPHSAVYTYNGDGLRVSKAVDGAAAVYQAWAVIGQPQVVRDGTTDYLWSGSIIAQIPMGATAQYAEGDGLGSMRQITGNTGQVVGAQQYDAYGKPQQQSGVQAQPTPAWSIGYTGQQMDWESGLVYDRTRYYDWSSGRFTSQDSWGAAPAGSPGQSWYAYANNNPQRWSDPSGHTTQGLLDSGICDDAASCAPYAPRFIVYVGLHVFFNDQFIHSALWIIKPGGGSLFFEGKAEHPGIPGFILDPGDLEVRLTTSSMYGFDSYTWVYAGSVDASVDVERVLGSIRDDVNEQVDGKGIAYDYTGPNSNSVVFLGLTRLGITPRENLTDYVPGFGYLGDPGWNISLEGAITEKKRPRPCVPAPVRVSAGQNGAQSGYRAC